MEYHKQQKSNVLVHLSIVFDCLWRDGNMLAILDSKVANIESNSLSRCLNVRYAVFL